MIFDSGDWVSWIVGGAGVLLPSAGRSQDEEYENYRDRPSTWERPVQLGHLVIAALGFMVALGGLTFTVFNTAAAERVSAERRVTEISERQNAVLNTLLPQIRQELADLHRVDRDRDSQVGAMEAEITALRLEVREHFAQDASRRRGGRND